MTGIEIVVIVAFTMVGACIQGSVGIGLALVAGPALVAIDPGFAPGPLLLAGMVIGARHVVVERNHVDRTTVRNAFFGAPIGVAAALGVLLATSDSAMALIVGGLTIGAAIALLLGAHIRQTSRSEVAGGAAIAFSSVAAGLPGPPAAVVFSGLAPPAMRGTTSTIVMGIALVGGVGLVATGEYGGHEVELTALMLPGVTTGLLLARFVRPHLDRAWFRPAVLTVALIGGLALVIKELM